MANESTQNEQATLSKTKVASNAKLLFRVGRSLADLRITVVLLLIFAVETLLGTLMQATEGLWAAQQMFFHNWFGVPLVGLLAVINLCAVLVFRLRWKLQNIGLLILHVGLILLLVFAGISGLQSNTVYMDLGHGERSAKAYSNQEWEIAFRIKGDSLATVWSVDFSELSEELVLNLGPYARDLKVQKFMPNAMIMGNSIVPVAGDKSPENWVPAVQFYNGVVLSGAQEQPLVYPLVLASAKPAFQGDLALRYKSELLPFSLYLKSFKRDNHPGTLMASAYESTVLVNENGVDREVKISMNNPLRIGDFTVFQSSWRTDPTTGLDRSILSITKNPVRTGPYIATLLIALGMLLHMFMHTLKHVFKKEKTPALHVPVGVVLLSLAMALSPTANAAENANQKTNAKKVPIELQRLPILVDGRVKPLETYAQHLLLQFSGNSKIAFTDSLGQKTKYGAVEWMAQVMLGNPNSELVLQAPIFLIENPEVRDALQLSGKERDRYNWEQLYPVGPRLDSLAKIADAVKSNDRSAFQRDVLRVAKAWNSYFAVVHAFDFLIDSSLYKPYANFLDFALHSKEVKPRLDSLLKLPADSVGVNDRAYFMWIDAVLGSADAWALAELNVTPLQLRGELHWSSPGTLLLQEGADSLDLRNQLIAWANLRKAWNADSLDIQQAAQQLEKIVLKEAEPLGLRSKALRVEHFYNQLNPFYYSLILYGFMFIVALVALKKQSPALIKLAAFWGLATLALHGVGMVMRMYITLRPPVTNLYETFVFAGACSVLLLLVWGHFRKFNAAPALAAVAGFSMLLLARRYGMDGDTMPVLAAVLDSNFWLTIHVISITIGYAGVVAGGLVAHWHLIQVRLNFEALQIARSVKLVREIMAMGLLFTFVGTLLGGVWADQSWGRFWGWDPKENGALLIILWVAMQFHAVPAGLMKPRGFSLASIFAIQTVLFAWFGVNLMGVGLHSYGFTEGTLIGLSAFAGLEVLFVLWVLLPHKK